MKPLAELHVVAGPMFSGKTDELISTFLRTQQEGSAPIACKPAIDDRHPATVIRSHSGREIPAVAVSDARQLLRLDPEHVLVDEVQFFDLTLDAAIGELRARGVRVTVAGLDLDFARRPFEVTEALIRAATVVSRRESVCMCCGRPAPFTQRLVDGKPAPLNAARFVVGDDESYEPRCERCWLAERTSVLPA